MYSEEDIHAENARLRLRILQLENKLNFLVTHSTLARGISGEQLVSRAIDGVLTVHTASADVITTEGFRIEVKNAKLTNAGAHQSSPYRRWMWQKVFGETNSKQYDFLLLVGEANTIHSIHYRDTVSPYVMFCIPFDRVPDFVTAGTRLAVGIQLSSNPLTARGRAKSLFSEFQITMVEFQTRFGSLKQNDLEEDE